MSKLEEWASDQGVNMSTEEGRQPMGSEGLATEDDLPKDDETLHVVEDEPVADSWEDKARKTGWVPEDEWQGDPDKWSPAREWVRVGEVMDANRHLKSKIDNIEQNFDARINNLQQFHDQRIEAERNRIKAEMKQAVSEADTETFEKKQDELDALDAKPVAKPNEQASAMDKIIQHPSTQAFIQKNPYITNPNDPKGVFGQKVFADWLNENINNPNAILEDGLRHVEEVVSKNFPNNQSKPKTPSMGNKGGGPKRAGGVKHALTFDDLTKFEKDMWYSFGSSYKSEEEFLQTVADARAEG